MVSSKITSAIFEGIGTTLTLQRAIVAQVLPFNRQ